MEHVIYDSRIDDIDLQAAKDVMQEYIENESELSDEKVWQMAEDEKEIWLGDEKENLNVATKGRIICLAQLGLWDGTKPAVRLLGNNLNHIFAVGSAGFENEVCFYADSDTKEVMCSQAHHDGTNVITFREIKPGIKDITPFIEKYISGKTTDNDVNKYTRSIYLNVANIYGWS
ncbi:hypothetical protein [Parabacteroides merdae]|jgi:hypothetical protein|uniref:hypothetical protein n=1 Tax=Parabacteroides merdae TaxID=46503 RepID=UPI0034A1DA01